MGANVEGMPMCMWERAAERKKRLGVRRQWVVAHRVRVEAAECAQGARRRGTSATVALAAATARSAYAALVVEEGFDPRGLRVARRADEHNLRAAPEHRLERRRVEGRVVRLA